MTEPTYKYGFSTELESDQIPKGLDENVIRLISKKKNEPLWMLEQRLKAFQYWQSLTPPSWAGLNYPPLDFQDICYYSAPKKRSEDPKKWKTLIPSS